ncbi:MAG: hypothetical protein PHQ43_04300 [Dehalococcoidales bacterium]|nr:hypothetical protein [Dehalococcoidales bacterium]
MIKALVITEMYLLFGLVTAFTCYWRLWRKQELWKLSDWKHKAVIFLLDVLAWPYQMYLLWR